MTSYSKRHVIGWQSCRGIQSLTDTAVKIALVLTAVAALPATLAAALVAAGAAGGALASIPAGALADRFESRALLRLTLAVELVLAAAGGVSLIVCPSFVVLTGLAVTLGAVNAVANTAFSCLPVQVVPKQHLSETLATGQGFGRMAGILGAPLGAATSVWTGQSLNGFGALLLVHAIGVGLCFLGITRWVHVRYPKTSSASNLRSLFTKGPLAVYSHTRVRRLVVCLVGSNVWVGPVTAIGLAIAFTQAGVVTIWVGICQAALGGAAFAATIIVGRLGAPKATYGLVSLAIQGLALVGIGFGNTWVSMACMIVVGFTAGIASISLGRELVTVTPSHLLGRASALTQGIDVVLTPVSFVFFGWVTQTLGTVTSAALYGICAFFMFVTSATTYVADTPTESSPEAAADSLGA